MTKEPGDDGIGLEYLLNFFGSTGHCKHEQWTPTGDSDSAHAAKKKSANAFLDHLHSTVDQWHQCQIYQLEDICIKDGETPDELVEYIQNLTDRCSFPDDAEKECHVQLWFIHALNDPELVWKLLAMKINVNNSQMIKSC